VHMKADDRVLLAIIAGAALLELAARYRRRKQQPQVLGGHAARTPPDTQQPQETQEAARLLSGERSQPPSPPPVSFAVDALAGFALSDASAIAEVEAKAGGAKALGKQLIQALHEKGHATILPLITPAAARVKNKSWQKGEDLLPLHYAAGHNASPTVIRRLLEAYPDGAKTKTSGGSLPLHIAAGHNADVAVVRLLLEAYPEAKKVFEGGATGLLLPMDRAEIGSGLCHGPSSDAVKALLALTEEEIKALRLGRRIRLGGRRSVSTFCLATSRSLATIAVALLWYNSIIKYEAPTCLLTLVVAAGSVDWGHDPYWGHGRPIEE